MTQNVVPTPSDPLLKLAYDAADRLLLHQQAVLQGIRTRATGVVATAALLVTVPYGLGFATRPGDSDTLRGSPFPLWASWTLLGILVAVSLTALATLWPIEGWTFTANATRIVKLRDDGQGEVFVLKDQIEAMTSGAQKNRDLIKSKQALYQASIGLMLLEAAILTLGVIFT